MRGAANCLSSDCPKTSLIAVTEAKPAPVAAWARSIGRFARKTHAQVGTLIIVEMPTLAPRATRRSIGPIHPRRTKPAPPHRQAWPRPQTPRVKPSQREWLHSRSERSWALPELSFSRARSASPGASCGASRRPAANRSATAAQPPTHGHPEPGISLRSRSSSASQRRRRPAPVRTPTRWNSHFASHPRPQIEAWLMGERDRSGGNGWWRILALGQLAPRHERSAVGTLCRRARAGR